MANTYYNTNTYSILVILILHNGIIYILFFFYIYLSVFQFELPNFSIREYLEMMIFIEYDE